jgi:predicted dehydrogenase
MAATTPIRWGILATGTIATAFTQDLALLPDAVAVAVGSRTPAAARAFADRHGIDRAYGSWRELAEDSEVDVVYVATPHAAHHAAAKLCLRAGKAVLCEKPLTLDAAQAEDLVATARAHGVFLMEAMWTRANPVVRRLVALVAAGAIGEVTAVSADFGIAGPFPPGHRLRAPELGGGALLDLGVYPVTLAHLFLGEPRTVAAVAALTPEGTDQNTVVVLGYGSGALASLHCGFVGDTGHRAVLTGTDGRIELPRHFYRPDGFTLVRAGQAEEFTMALRGNGLAYQAEEVMRCLREGLVESPLVPHRTSVAVMRVLDAARAQIGVTYPTQPMT